MRKNIKICLLFICISLFATAQEVSHKDIDFKRNKGFVVVNKQNVFKLKYDSSGYWYVHDLNTGEELMYFYLNRNETLNNLEDDYWKVYFTKSKKSFETKTRYYVIMEKLINEKVITPDWHVDESKIADFIDKYDENITNRTTR